MLLFTPWDYVTLYKSLSQQNPPPTVTQIKAHDSTETSHDDTIQSIHTLYLYMISSQLIQPKNGNYN